MRVDLTAGLSTGIGSLPHRDASAAAELALSEMGLAAIPQLPRRSPAEGMIAQAVVGIPGVSLGQYGSIAVDVAELDPLAPVTTDVSHDAFVGFRAFLDAAQGHTGPVKWQLTGPITLGLALTRAGALPSVAFEVAVRAVRGRAAALLDLVSERLPDCPQVVFFDEPSLVGLMEPGFPLPPDVAMDLLSGALAVAEPVAACGVHCCGAADWATVLEAGPCIVSAPATGHLLQFAGYLSSFLERGGIVAWGVVATDGPVPSSPERPWRQLSALWCELVQRGCDPVLLRQQSLVTPACGLALHDETTAVLVHRVVQGVADRVHDQAVATRLTIRA
jgi:hypothetical protein